MTKKLVIAQETARPSAMNTLAKTRVCKASHKMAANADDAENQSKSDAKRCLPAEKTNKLSRINNLRKVEGISDILPAVTIRRDKEERSRDLQTMELFRMACK